MGEVPRNNEHGLCHVPIQWRVEKRSNRRALGPAQDLFGVKSDPVTT